MKKNLNFLFYLRSPKIKKNGEAPIFLRITVDGLRAETSTGRSIDPNKWDPKLQMQKGRSEEAKTLNLFLNNIKLKVFQKPKSSLLLYRKQKLCIWSIVMIHSGLMMMGTLYTRKWNNGQG
jgi:hypothetical protein